MGELNRIFGAGAKLEHAGKVYTLSPWTFGVQAEYEAYLEKEAWQTCLRARDSLPEPMLKELRAQTAQDITAGVYAAGGEHALKSLWAPRHAKMFLYLLIEPHHPNVSKEKTDALFDENPSLCLEKLFEAGSDPSRPSPATTSPAGGKAATAGQGNGSASSPSSLTTAG